MKARGERYVRALLAVLTLAVTASLSTHAVALPPWVVAQTPDWKTKQEARKAYASGKTKMTKGDFAGALEDFRTADRLVPGAAPKYQAAVCLDRLGRLEEAVAAYRAFLDSNPGDKYASEVAEATQRVTALEQQLVGKVRVTVAPAGVAATITVDGQPAAGPELELKPGTHTIVVTAPGHQEATQTVEVKAGATADVSITLVPTTAPAPQPPPIPGDDDDDESNGTPLMIAGGVLLGVGVVFGVLTTVFGVKALDAKDEFDAGPTHELADDAESNALLADVFLGIAAGTGAIGIVLLAVGAAQGGGDEEEAARPRVVPFAGPHGGGAAITWTF